MYGSETISSLGPKIWDILSTKLKKVVSPTLFKKKIRKWEFIYIEFVYIYIYIYIDRYVKV